MYRSILLLSVIIFLISGCTKKEGLDIPKYRIAYVLINKSTDTLKNRVPSPYIFPSDSYIFPGLSEDTIPEYEDQIFQPASPSEKPLFFSRLYKYNEYAFLEKDKTYSLAIFHQYDSYTQQGYIYDVVENFVFTPSNYLPNSQNQFILNNGNYELVVGVYE
jgi:hypothetical protein